jgi:DmsE family decaheme c-type cytochrome
MSLRLDNPSPERIATCAIGSTSAHSREAQRRRACFTLLLGALLCCAAARPAPAQAPVKEGNENCLDCHHGQHADFEHSAHGQAGVKCLDCHTVHAAGSKKPLLKAEQPDLCFQCHSDVKAEFSQTFHHDLDEGKVKCSDCHDPHASAGSNVPASHAQQIAACTKCHTAMAGPFEYEHPAIKAEGCTACHVPHGGPDRHLLNRASVNTICQQCHSPAPDMTTPRPQPSAHTRATQNQPCVRCHTGIHGSNMSAAFLDSP